MKEIDWDKALIYAVSIALAIVAAVFINKIKRSRGKNPIFHGVFVVASILTLLFLPEEIQDTVFSPGGVGKATKHLLKYCLGTGDSTFGNFCWGARFCFGGNYQYCWLLLLCVLDVECLSNTAIIAITIHVAFLHEAK